MFKYSIYKNRIRDDAAQHIRLDDLTEAPDLVKTMTVSVSPLHPAALGRHIPLVGARVASTASVLCGTGLGVLPRARFPDAASDLVGAGRDDGTVVIRVGIRGAGDGREERVGRVAVPAGRGAHGAGVGAPGTDGSDAGFSVLIITRGAFDLPELGIVAREGLLHRILAHDGVGVAEDVADVVASPLAYGVRFEDSPAVYRGMRLFADADLSVPLTEFHAAFGRAVAAGHYTTVAVGFVEGDFIAGPVDDSVGGGCFGQAVGLFVREQGGRKREEQKGRV